VYSLPGVCESTEEEAPLPSAGGMAGGRPGSRGGELGAEEAAVTARRSCCAASVETAREARGERGALAGRGAFWGELRRRELGRLPPESEPVETPRP
jgi:hypothetical protein